MAKPKQTVSVRLDLPREVDRAIEAAAFKQDKTKRYIVEAAVRSFLGMKEVA